MNDMPARRKVISICTPCYNEAGGIRECWQTIKDIFEKELPEYDREHIFADNASTDGTLEILKEIAAGDPQVRVIANARNFGIVRSGFNAIINASGDATFMFMPADLQDPPELMPQFVRLWEQGYEVVYGIRESREESPVMIFVRNFYYRIISKLSGLDIPRQVGDYQLVDRRVIEAIRRYDDAYPFTRVMPFQCSNRTAGIPYRWRARKTGFSKNRMVNLIDQGLNGIISITSVPSRIALMLGASIAGLSLVFAVFRLIGTLIAPTDTAPGIHTLIIGMFFMNGLLLFFIGLIGEYIISIHAQVRRQPLIVERERINFPPHDQA